MPADPLALLVAPRETLRVFEYVAEHPRTGPDEAVRALGVSHHTWYAALRRLEGLQLVVLGRAPGGKKVRHVLLTDEGREAMRLLARLREITEGSVGALEAELDGDPMVPGSDEAGEVLVRLIDRASGRGEEEVMERAARRAEALGRPGEAALARGVRAFNEGEVQQAVTQLAGALQLLEHHPGSASYRRALFYQAAVLELTGQSHKAIGLLTRLRQVAHAAGDRADEADARLAYGIIKCKRGQLADGLKHLRKALECARASGNPWRVAKVLNNMALAKFLADPREGLAESLEAELILQPLGGRVQLVHMHNNRALMFAVAGRTAEARAQMREGRRLARAVGFERGAEVRDGWDRVVARLVKDGGATKEFDWRGEIMRLLALKSDATARSAKDKGPGPG